MSGFTIKQIAKLMRLTQIKASELAIDEQWEYTIINDGDNEEKSYSFQSFSNLTKTRLIGNVHVKHAMQSATVNNEIYKNGETNLEQAKVYFNTTSKRAACLVDNHIFLGQLEPEKLTRPFVRLGIIILACAYTELNNVEKKMGYKKFSEMYNNRTLKLDESIYKTIKSISQTYLYELERDYKVSFIALAGLSTISLATNNKTFKEISQELKAIYPNMSPSFLREYLTNLYPDTPDINLNLAKTLLNLVDEK